MFTCLSLYLPVCLSVYLFLLSTCLPVCLLSYLFVPEVFSVFCVPVLHTCLPVHPFTCVYLSVCLFVRLSVCLYWFICILLCLFTCLSVYICLLSVNLSEPLYLSRCRRPKSQQPSVVLMWDRLLMVAGVCNDTIQYPLNQFRLELECLAKLLLLLIKFSRVSSKW